MQRMKHKIIWISIFSLGVLAGIFFTAKWNILPKSDAVILPQREEDKSRLSGSTAFSIENAIVDVASEVGKAVVSISTVRTEKVSRGYRRFYFGTPFEDEPFGDDSFRRFFEDFFGELPEREFKQMGLGSGVIIDNEGYILTNEHVIGDADKITVTLPDGREFEGVIKGRDTRVDLAVIKINARNLPVARLGDSDKVKIGQWVVAIGNPFGIALHSAEPTVTVGVVSALHRSLGRSLSRDRDFSDLIQTDAAINPGNSGGPLVNLMGEVVGINVAIFSTTGGYQGVGFAIPCNRAKRILTRLIEGKEILYGWLGVTVQDLDEELADYFGIKDRSGVLVSEVIEDGPADKAGVKSGDIIRLFDGKKIPSVRELLRVVGNTDVGSKVKLGVFRDRKEFTLVVKIGERPEDISPFSYKSKKGEGSWRGISVKNIDQKIKERFNLEDLEGVVIVDVEPDSPADDAGILDGDIIEAIDRTKIKDVDDFKRVTKDLKGDALIRTGRGYKVIKE